jgi:glycerate-2-kinase
VAPVIKRGPDGRRARRGIRERGKVGTGLRPPVLFQNPASATEEGADPAARKEIVQIFTAALRGADAYALVRRAVHEEEGVLRIGNRLLPRESVREIAFVAAGTCADAMAAGFHDALRESVTQGFVLSPRPLEHPTPFPHAVVPDAVLPSQEGARGAEGILELAEGLGPRDLLVPLLSPGALAMLAASPPGVSLEEVRDLAAHLRTEPERRVDLATVLSPAQGGGLVRGAKGARVEALVLQRGEGGAAIGAGPAAPPDPEAPRRLRSALQSSGLWQPLSPALQRALEGSHGPAGTYDRAHTVVIGGPAEALEVAGEEAAHKTRRARLGTLHDGSAPAEAAENFLRTLDEHASRLPEDGRHGVALLSGLSLGTPEAGERTEEVAEFLHAVHARLRRREVTVGVLSTGGTHRREITPCGGVTDAMTPLDPWDGTAQPPWGLNLRPGITDVGILAVALVAPRARVTPAGRGSGRRSSA